MPRKASIDPLEVVANMADAAFATDDGGRIVIWNRAAERLLGHDAARVLGRPCHEVVCGRDIYGNRYCDEVCALVRMVRRREPVRHFEMNVQTSAGEILRVDFSIVVIPGPRPAQFCLVHMMRTVGDPMYEAPPGLSLPAPTAASAVALTAREREVLSALANGCSTQEMADTLFISKATVRHHVQSILQKLNVHSKLSAVSLALRNRLI